MLSVAIPMCLKDSLTCSACTHIHLQIVFLQREEEGEEEEEEEVIVESATLATLKAYYLKASTRLSRAMPPREALYILFFHKSTARCAQA